MAATGLARGRSMPDCSVETRCSSSTRRTAPPHSARPPRRSRSNGVVGIVVNRVADARTIFERLDLPGERKLLLTGRVRGWERDKLVQQWMPRLRAGVREGIDAPLAVAATQCIEVGANLDF